MNTNGVTSASQFTQWTALSPIPFITVSGLTIPHAGHLASTKGSPVKRPITGSSFPEAVTVDVTSIFLMCIAIASPTSAASTKTGLVTSCPPF